MCRNAPTNSMPLLSCTSASASCLHDFSNCVNVSATCPRKVEERLTAVLVLKKSSSSLYAAANFGSNSFILCSNLWCSSFNLGWRLFSRKAVIWVLDSSWKKEKKREKLQCKTEMKDEKERYHTTKTETLDLHWDLITNMQTLCCFAVFCFCLNICTCGNEHAFNQGAPHAMNGMQRQSVQSLVPTCTSARVASINFSSSVTNEARLQWKPKNVDARDAMRNWHR